MIGEEVRITVIATGFVRENLPQIPRPPFSPLFDDLEVPAILRRERRTVQ